MALVRVLKVTSEGIKVTKVVSDRKIIEAIVGGPWAVCPLDENIGAALALKVYPETPAYAAVVPALKTEAGPINVFGDFIVGKFLKGELVNLEDSDIFLAKSYLLEPNVLDTAEEVPNVSSESGT